MYLRVDKLRPSNRMLSVFLHLFQYGKVFSIYLFIIMFEALFLKYWKRVLVSRCRQWKAWIRKWWNWFQYVAYAEPPLCILFDDSEYTIFTGTVVKRRLLSEQTIRNGRIQYFAILNYLSMTYNQRLFSCKSSGIIPSMPTSIHLCSYCRKHGAERRLISSFLRRSDFLVTGNAAERS